MGASNLLEVTFDFDIWILCSYHWMIEWGNNLELSELSASFQTKDYFTTILTNLHDGEK